MKSSRPNLVVANWKMNPGSAEEARETASRVEHGLLGINRLAVTAAICPPLVFLPAVRLSLHFAALGVQNLSGAAAEQGAFTGEVSAKMLKEFGASYAIVGHSERRAMGENDALINQKIHNALKYKITPILCVGFGVAKGASAAVVKRVVKTQLISGFKGVKFDRRDLVVAYEPVWAIGTGQPASPVHAAEILEFVRSILPKARLLYGGSLNGKNAAGFAARKVIDGALVGGASLAALDFLKIVRSFAR